MLDIVRTAALTTATHRVRNSARSIAANVLPEIATHRAQVNPENARSSHAVTVPSSSVAIARSRSVVIVRRVQAQKAMAVDVRSTSAATVRTARALKLQAQRHVRFTSVVTVRRDRHAMVRDVRESSESVRPLALTRLTKGRSSDV